MNSGPVFESVDAYTSDLLDLVAYNTPPRGDDWTLFTNILRDTAHPVTGRIDPNTVRPLLRGKIEPRRLSAFWHRASTEGVIARDGWITSDDREGRNAGRPCRVYRWCGP